MTTRGSGAASARGEVPWEELGVPLLLDAGKGCPAAGCPTETTPGASVDKDLLAKMAAERATKFVFRGLLILLWLYLFNSMREYAISYTGGDIRFSTFAAIVVAVPIAEIFGIMGQTLVPLASHPIGSWMPCSSADSDSEVPTEEGLDAVFLDLEKGRPGVYTTAPMPADAMTRAAIQAALDMAALRMTKCFVRGLLVLLWVFLVDLMRRFIATHHVGVLLFTMTPLLILAAGVSLFLCLLMESCGEFIHNDIVSYAGARIGS